jgi:hypothetical protein
MDTQKYELVNELSEALKPYWSHFSEDSKAYIKSVVAKINDGLLDLAATQRALTDTPLPEARRTDWLVVYNEGGGVEVHCTFRSNSDTDVEARMAAFLDRHGIRLGPVWTSLDTKIVNRKEANDAQRQPVQVAAQPVATQAARAITPNQPNKVQTNEAIFSVEAIQLEPVTKSMKDKGLMWGVKTPLSQFATRMYKDSAKTAYDALQSYGIDTEKIVEGNGDYIIYDLTGWTAHYTKDKEGKHPAKIVNLIPPQK